VSSKSYSTTSTDQSVSSQDSFSTESSYKADTTLSNSNNVTTSTTVTESKELVSALNQANKNLADISVMAVSGLNAFATKASDNSKDIVSTISNNTAIVDKVGSSDMIKNIVVGLIVVIIAAFIAKGK
jgi:ABC-type transporter Mla subunit MlaD